MTRQELRLLVEEDREVSAILTRPESCRPGLTPGLVLAHGANNDLEHPLLAAVAEELAERGIASTLRFNFPYRERGATSPDRPEILELTFRRAHDLLADDDICPPGALFLGGKSLGARVAAELVSRRHEGEGLLADGLIFLGYPLHAPGRTEKLRTEPLRRIDVPSLFIEGTKDPFCDLELLRPVLDGLNHPPLLHPIENGGHSFEVPKSDGRSEAQVYAEVAGSAASFIERTTHPTGRP